VADQSTVVSFPKAKVSRGPKNDAELTEDIRRAWRKLARTIKAAQAAGLTVETDFYEHRQPTITRRL
jgi:hypothetical protein